MEQIYKLKNWQGKMQCKTSPFSGGGDISIFGGSKSAVVETLGLETDLSPKAAGEGQFVFKVDAKYAERNNDKGLKQLLANMLLCTSHSLNCCEDAQTLESLSFYGLLLDHLLPLQLFKLKVNFTNSEIKIVTIAGYNHGASIYTVCDKLITYMIKNIGD